MSSLPKHFLDEFSLISRLTSRTEASLPPGQLGPGDDCAVLPGTALGFSTTKRQLLLTTDSLVDGVHFRLSQVSPEDLGWKSLAVSVSDVAAMGGMPHAAVIALHTHDAVTPEFLERLYDGVQQAAARYDVAIVGGDVVRSEVFSLNVSLLGSCAGQPVLRSGALPEQDLWVSGELGGASAGFLILEERLAGVPPEDKEALLRRHRRPVPRILLGQVLLQRHLASALIDVSDGLFADAQHIAEASRVDLFLDVDALPCADEALRAGLSRLRLCTGGEDYELLFAAPRSARPALEDLSGGIVKGQKLPKLSRIGAVEAAADVPGLKLRFGDGRLVSAAEALRAEGISSAGYKHF